MESWQSLTRKRLYDEAEGICHLCGYHIRWDLKGNLELSPTIDHIVPRSKGGRDVIENMAIAHRWCNGKRGRRNLTARLKRIIKRGYESGLVHPYGLAAKEYWKKRGRKK